MISLQRQDSYIIFKMDPVSAATYDYMVNQFYNNRYIYLKRCASLSLNRIKRNTTELMRDLVTESFLYINKNKEKLLEKIVLSGMIEAICVNYMNHQVLWNNTDFKKQYLYSQNPTYKIFNYETRKSEKMEYHFVDIADHDSYIMEEQQDEEFFIKEQLEYQDKITRYNNMLDKMTTEQRCLFDIVYVKGHNSALKLAEYFKDYGCESRSTCYYMLRDLRNWITKNL